MNKTILTREKRESIEKLGGCHQEPSDPSARIKASENALISLLMRSPESAAMVPLLPEQFQSATCSLAFEAMSDGARSAWEILARLTQEAGEDIAERKIIDWLRPVDQGLQNAHVTTILDSARRRTGGAR